MLNNVVPVGVLLQEETHIVTMSYHIGGVSARIGLERHKENMLVAQRGRRRRSRQKLLGLISMPSSFFCVVLVFLFATDNNAVVNAQEPCTVCLDGSNVPLPDKSIQIDGIPVNSCAELETSAAFLLTGTEFCDGIQNIGTLCGCPIPENACHLCQDGTSRATNLTLELARYSPQEFIPVAPPDTILTCETLEAALHSINTDEARCMEIQFDAGVECGCPAAPPDGGGGNFTDVIPTTSPAPSTSMAPTNPPREVCPLCANGGTITQPERNISLGDLPIDTCSDLDAFAALLTPGSFECTGIQTLGPYCGCPVPEDVCTFCPNGEPVPRPDRHLDWFTSTFLIMIPDTFKSIGDDLTCGLMESISMQLTEDVFAGAHPDFACLSLQLKSWICGCSIDYRAILFTWAYRGSGILSLLCSSLIIRDVIRKTRKHNMVITTYHQLVLGISFFDCVSSFAYIMVGVMAPRESGFYLSIGNYDTCKAQAFLIQFGLTSVFYNMLLAIYFYLVVCHNWKEADFKKLRRWLFHVLLFCFGLGLSIAALPHTGSQFGICYLVPPPAVESYLPIDLLLTTPISLALGVLTLSTVAICVKVYRQELKAKKWAMRSRRMLMTKKVFWQSFWYVMAFCVTLPFQIVAYYFPNVPHSFSILLVGGFVSPLQGTMNAFVYFQRSKGARFFWAAARKACCFCSVSVWGSTRCCGRKKQDDGGDGKNLDGPKSTDHQQTVVSGVSGLSGASAPFGVGDADVHGHINGRDDVEQTDTFQGWMGEGEKKGQNGTMSYVQHSMPQEDGKHSSSLLIQEDEEEPSNVRARTGKEGQLRFTGVVEFWRLNEDSGDFSEDEVDSGNSFNNDPHQDLFCKDSSQLDDTSNSRGMKERMQAFATMMGIFQKNPRMLAGNEQQGLPPTTLSRSISLKGEDPSPPDTVRRHSATAIESMSRETSFEGRSMRNTRAIFESSKRENASSSSMRRSSHGLSSLRSSVVTTSSDAASEETTMASMRVPERSSVDRELSLGLNNKNGVSRCA